MTKKNKRRGFTIVELVIVIAVIAILAAVLIPTYANLVKKANEAKAQAEAKNLVTEMLTNIILGNKDSADLLVFSKKGNDVYLNGYSAEQQKFLTYRDNPFALKTDIETTAQAAVDELLEKGVIERNPDVDNKKNPNDWRLKENVKTIIETLSTKYDVVVYANYIINADKFAVHVHSFGAWENADAENHIRRCSCGATETAKHEWGEWKVTTEAKVTSRGEKTHTCKNCKETETAVIPATVEATLEKANKALEGTSPKTMYDAMVAIGTDLEKAIEEAVGKITSKDASNDKNCVLWDSENNVFCFADNGTIRYIGDTKEALSTKYHYWKIATGVNTYLSSKYSNYLANGYAKTSVSSSTGNKGIRTGVDVGRNTNITDIIIVTYTTGSESKTDVIIRTNGTENVKIGIARTATHYGTAASVTITNSTGSSSPYKSSLEYIECGKVTGGITVKRSNVTVDLRNSLKTPTLSARSGYELKEISDGVWSNK